VEAVKRLLALVVVVALPLACSTEHQVDSASLKIDAGWFAGEGGELDNSIPAVMRIESSVGSCTSTAVSDNTLLTAGHCVGRDVDAQGRVSTEICIKSGTMAYDKCSTEIYTPRAWTSYEDFRLDIAVVIFPRNTFKSWFPLATDDVKIGDKLALVGYSERNMTEQGKGSKRWGFNNVGAFTEQSVIVTHYRGTASAGVGVSPGDSGGPMFTDCKVIGVASRMDFPAGGKIGLHTNTTDRDNRAWLLTMREKGGELCGLPGAKAEMCDGGLGVPAPEAETAPGAQPAFPCTTGIPALPPPPRDVYFALDDANHLYASVPAGAQDVTVCTGHDLAACKANKITMSFHRDLAGRKVYKTAAPVSLIGDTHPFAALVWDASGKPVALEKIDVKH